MSPPSRVTNRAVALQRARPDEILQAQTATPYRWQLRPMTGQAELEGYQPLVARVIQKKSWSWAVAVWGYAKPPTDVWPLRDRMPLIDGGSGNVRDADSSSRTAAAASLPPSLPDTATARAEISPGHKVSWLHWGQESALLTL
jgi:hypothetical protein